MSDARLAPRRPWFSAFSRRWRLYLVLALASILPLLLFLYAGHWLLRKITINNLLGQSELAAATAGRVVEDSLKNDRLAIESFASDPVTVDVWRRRDIERLTTRLREAHDLKRETASWGMYDSKGFLRVSYPQSSAELDRSFASSDWFTAAMRSRTTQVSSAPAAGNASRGLVITVAAPIA